MRGTTRHRLLLLLVLLLPLAGIAAQDGRRKGPPRVPRLGGKEKKELVALFKSYFKAGEADRPAILDEVAKRDPIPASAVKDLRKKLFELARTSGPRLTKKAKKLDHPDYPGTFIIRGAKGGKEKGLFIGLHGGGAGAGDGKTSAQKWSGTGCITLFPTVIKKESSAWNKEREERYVLELIEAVKRTYRVDTNRIYLAGHSMGGYGTWSIGGHHADLFAALSPNAGGIFVRASRPGGITGLAPGILPNLCNTPVYFTHGADDTRVSVKPDRLAAKLLGELKTEHPDGFDFEYHEYPDIGHGLPPKGMQPIVKWMTSRRRDPYPKKVVWEPVVRFKRSFFWLRKENPGGGVIVAENLGDNVFSVTTKGSVYDLSLYVNKSMIDMKKPVTVTLNGEKVFSDFVLPSAAALLCSIAERNDRKMYFTAWIPLGER